MSDTYYIPCIVLLAVLLAACGQAEGDEAGRGPEASENIPSVEAVQARRGSLPLEERLSGTVRAENQVAIYPEVNAPVTAVYVENGDYVSQGTPMVRLKSRSSQDQLQQAEADLQMAQAEAQQAQANLENVRAQFERIKSLAEKDLVSRQELETKQAELSTAEANYERAQARVAQARAAIAERQESVSQTVVRAPISGYVGQRNAEVGMRADGSTRLFTIGRLDRVRVNVALTQSMLNRLEVGQTARIALESRSDTVVTGELSRISPFLESGSYSAEAEIEVPNEDGLLRPGMFVTVDVHYGESQQATLVPKSAMYENPTSGVGGIYVATSLGTEVEPITTPDEEGRAPLTEPTPVTFKEVNVLAEGGDMVGVTGINDGDWVITVGQDLLQDRSPSGETVEARVRPITWERILALQGLQREDLLRRFMEKQQRMARARLDSVQATALTENTSASGPLG